MTYRILASRVKGTDFEAKVAAHAADMTAWRTHMRNVEKSPGIYQAYPSPAPENFVVAAVSSADGETFVSDFEIVDDGPTPEQVLRGKQDSLLSLIRQLEGAAAHAIMPVGKRRLFNMQVADARKRDTLRGNAILSTHHERLKGFSQHQEKVALAHNVAVAQEIKAVESLDIPIEEKIKRINAKCGSVLDKIGDPPQCDVDSEICKVRSPEDTSLLDKSATMQASIDAIERHAAELAAEIEDLDAQTIDEWRPRSFPT